MNMTLTRTPMTSPAQALPCTGAVDDYSVVRRAVAYISDQWRAQPEIEAIAHAAGVTPDELHHLFRRWAGLTPKAFLQALTLDHARRLLRQSASVLDAAYEVGLSGPGRLHDLFVTHEAMSPGQWKAGGEGLTLAYGFHPSPFGIALVIATVHGLAGLAFADPGEESRALDDMRGRWPRAQFREDTAGTAALARRIFEPKLWQRDRPLRVVMIGTDFEVRVWETLLEGADGPRHHLFRHRRPCPRTQGGPRRRRRSRQESDLLRGAVPSRHRQERRPHRLSLGPDPQARHAGLGSRARGDGVREQRRVGKAKRAHHCHVRVGTARRARICPPCVLQSRLVRT